MSSIRIDSFIYLQLECKRLYTTIALYSIKAYIVIMSCKSKNCKDYEDYYAWENFKIEGVDNPYNLCDTDILPSMPDSCSRCKRAYRDYFRNSFI